ncbi:MAG: hypothetical protein WAL63_07915 [Solirubrobacteraceae bacterium]
MGYKILGFIVWRGATFYIQRRFSGWGAKAAAAGVAAAVVAGVLAAGRQATNQ